ncbi:MAG TPA: signal peptidase I [Xanthobacteraceae bacterium]|nr:signal peptidase I [Xanthobacteraceae bacterium]
MASLADYAPTQTGRQANDRRGPSLWVTALLTVLTPGLGHVYIGQARRGITLFVMVMIADTLVMFAMMSVLARFWMFAVSLSLLLALWLYIMADAIVRASRMQDMPQGSNRWTLYAGAFVLACLVFAAPCFFALHAKATGQLLLNAANDSMEPTLRAGEYFLADATYYRSRHPSRGEMVVYIHPQHPGEQHTRRVVAVEGDRIAVKGGRAIVNGMAVMEPYVDVGDPQAALNNMPEMRVPAGHVFVLGDNRANSPDSRATAAHGPVPVGNLIGRATDIAISRYLARMGRWIGTPSNL